MSAFYRWMLGLLLIVMLVTVPAVQYRWLYTHQKRLREVMPGVFYRSGEMSADGFREAIAQLHIKTIINLQDEFPDPELPYSLFDHHTIRESELCRELGVRYVYSPPDLLPRPEAVSHRPHTIEKFLSIMDDPTNFPVLIHCRAGLNRTGIMVAVYRMEYCGYSVSEAIDEMRANGFGVYGCTSANQYLAQYLMHYKRGQRQSNSVASVP